MRILVSKSYYLLILFLLVITKPYFLKLINNSKDIYINVINNSIQSNVIYKENYVYGKILYQNPYKFNEELIIAIDDTKININNYVINEKGLLGIIKNKYQNMAIVKLLTNPDILLQVQINNCYGLLKYDQKVLVTNVDAHCIININDKVYTSNLGYIGDNFLIGFVKKIQKDPNEIANTLEIELVNNEVLTMDVVVVKEKEYDNYN